MHTNYIHFWYNKQLSQNKSINFKIRIDGYHLKETQDKEKNQLPAIFNLLLIVNVVCPSRFLNLPTCRYF